MKSIRNIVMTVIFLSAGAVTTTGMSALLAVLVNSQWQTIEPHVCERSGTSCNRVVMVASN